MGLGWKTKLSLGEIHQSLYIDPVDIILGDNIHTFAFLQGSQRVQTFPAVYE